MPPRLVALSVRPAPSWVRAPPPVDALIRDHERTHDTARTDPRERCATPERTRTDCLLFPGWGLAHPVRDAVVIETKGRIFAAAVSRNKKQLYSCCACWSRDDAID